MNPLSTTQLRVASTAGVALAFTLVLSACSNPLENVVESATGSVADKLISEATGTEIEGLGSSEIPADFPGNVPLPGLTPQSVIGHTDEGKKTWMIHYQDGATEEVYNDYLAGLAAAGYTEKSNTNMDGAMRISQFENAEYSLNVSLAGRDDEKIMQLVVSSR